MGWGAEEFTKPPPDPLLQQLQDKPAGKRVSRQWADQMFSSTAEVEKAYTPPDHLSEISPGLRRQATQNLGGGGPSIQPSLLKQFERASQIDKEARDAEAAKRAVEDAAKAEVDATQRAKEDAEREVAAETERKAAEDKAAADEAAKKAAEKAAKEAKRKGKAVAAASEAAASTEPAPPSPEELARMAARDAEVRKMALDALRPTLEQVCRLASCRLGPNARADAHSALPRFVSGRHHR